MELDNITSISFILLIIFAIFIFGWLVVWRVVLSQFPQAREALKDFLGVGDNERKKKARELRRIRRESRSQQREKALRTAKELQEAVIKEKQRAAATAAGNNNININTRKTKNKAN